MYCPVLQIDGEAVSLLVPCADMANHVLNPNASYQFVPEADAFQLRALSVRWPQYSCGCRCHANVDGCSAVGHDSRHRMISGPAV